MATVGTLVSLGGIALACSLLFGSSYAQRQHQFKRHAAHQHRVELKQIAETNALLSLARTDIVDYRDSNDGYLPTDIDGTMLVLQHVDAWGEELRFEPESNHGIIRSAGPDKQFMTTDDLQTAIKGSTDLPPLLVMDARADEQSSQESTPQDE